MGPPPGANDHDGKAVESWAKATGEIGKVTAKIIAGRVWRSESRVIPKTGTQYMERVMDKQTRSFQDASDTKLMSEPLLKLKRHLGTF